MFTGLQREEAARFSFLWRHRRFSAHRCSRHSALTGESALDLSASVLFVGVVASLVTSYIAIRFFLSFLRRGRLVWFARYVWFVGAVVLALTFFG